MMPSGVTRDTFLLFRKRSAQAIEVEKTTSFALAN